METNKWILLFLGIIILIMLAGLMIYIKTEKNKQERDNAWMQRDIEWEEEWKKENDAWIGRGAGWTDWEDFEEYQKKQMEEFEAKQDKPKIIST